MNLRAHILGVESALPERVVTNAELAALHPSWKVAEVARRTGVDSRHIAGPEETALDLGERASRALLARIGVDPRTVQGILFCTETPDHVMPPNATLLQHRLGLPTSVMATDFSLACSGYIYGLFLARSLLVSGALENVLLVTGDTYSRLMNADDRGAMTLFGDGAAATFLAARPGEGGGLVDFTLGTDGGRAGCFEVPAGGARRPRSEATSKVETDRHGNRRSLEQIHMDGAAVLDFVKRDVPPAMRALLSRSGLTMDQIDLVVPHQASRMSFEVLQRGLAIPKEKVVDYLAHHGNTVSASIPIALREAEKAGRLRPGHRLMLVGFGVGLSWGTCLLEW